MISFQKFLQLKNEVAIATLNVYRAKNPEIISQLQDLDGVKIEEDDSGLGDMIKIDPDAYPETDKQLKLLAQQGKIELDKKIPKDMIGSAGRISFGRNR